MACMANVTVRAMTRSEFEAWRADIAEEYAAEQIAAGRWRQIRKAPRGAVAETEAEGR